MNKFVTMIAVAASTAVASVALSVNANAGAVLDRVLATKTLTVAAFTNWGRNSFLNDKHEFDGYDIDVAKGVAKYLGVQTKFVTPAWDIIVAGTWQGRWDLALGQMTPTQARAEKFDFPAVYSYTREVAVVHKDSKATKPSDLDGKVVGVPAGDTAESYANHNYTPDWIGAEPVQYKFTPGEVRTYSGDGISPYDDLRLGDGVRLDAVIHDEPTALDAIKAGSPFRVLGEPLFSAPGALVIEKGDKAFSDKIAAAIKTLRDDGTLSRLSMKWYGVDISVPK
ncbi:amino acid ABC transporter substrate-binding protein [Mesorhizobium sp. LSJC268A00]|uniref:transporter substrate-binding domain-containing protein n=1 Tax=unclassified Mesorhizobium TaxID=325217 RepID=UPI0003CF9C27|nr:transporter substrate-binding domain-containing protein [Mesorhizobium sp. LSJC268A00]ESW94409.1 amino acid ABC transporter substrate-binding protein [Mesorhizobium sp. LSJC268A00]